MSSTLPSNASPLSNDLASSHRLIERIEQLQQQIPDTVRLIAVSKTVAPGQIRLAYNAGIRDFGENRIQEAIKKQESLADLTDIRWHFLGHLQRNKARKAVEHFPWIHTVDSLKIAERLNHWAEFLEHQPQVCLQVKLRPDPNKHGWSVREIQEALPQLKQYVNLRLRGLMVIPPLDLEPEETLKVFEEAHDLAHAIQSQIPRENPGNFCLNQLSMGMSQDYPLAIEAGATMIRIGRSLFGERPDQKQFKGENHI